eukprot:Rmarinus@m.18299
MNSDDDMAPVPVSSRMMREAQEMAAFKAFELEADCSKPQDSKRKRKKEKDRTRDKKHKSKKDKKDKKSKKEKKEKREKKRHKGDLKEKESARQKSPSHSSSSSSDQSASSGEEHVPSKPDEEHVPSKPDLPSVERESWMMSAPSRPLIPTHDDQESKEPERPNAHLNELNPYWKNGGTGLPEEDDSSKVATYEPVKSVVGDGGRSWRAKLLRRAQETAKSDGKDVNEFLAERFSKEQLASMERSMAHPRDSRRPRDQDSGREGRHRESDTDGRSGSRDARDRERREGHSRGNNDERYSRGSALGESERVLFAADLREKMQRPDAFEWGRSRESSGGRSSWRDRVRSIDRDGDAGRGRDR